MLHMTDLTVKKAIVSTVIVLYVLTAIGILRKTNYNEIMREPKNVNTVKSIVGYSLDHQIAEHLKTYRCDLEIKSTSIPIEHHLNKTDIFYDNISDIFLTNAYIDNRLILHSYVRTVALIPANTTRLYCQIREKLGETQIIRRAVINKIWSENWGATGDMTYIPALLSCILSPKQGQKPDEISYSRNICQNSKYSLKINDHQLKKNTTKKTFQFVICVKPLQYKNDISQQLKQWIKIQKKLGVKKIVFYFSKLRKKSLAYLKNLNDSFIEIIQFNTHKYLTIPSQTFEQKTWLKRKLEILNYNNCFYRNLETADYIIPLDLDEILVPKKEKTFQKMLENYSKKISTNNWLEYIQSFSSILVKNVYFFKKYPKFLNSSNLVKYYQSPYDRNFRSLRYSPGMDASKSFINVNNTISIFNHFSFESISSFSRQTMLPVDVAQLNHYRESCDIRLIQNCSIYLNHAIYDDSLRKLLH